MDMVKSITSFSSNGLRDWLLQRITAVILGVFFLVVLGFFVANPNPTYQCWYALFDCNAMKLLTIFALLSMVMHGWIGLWIVLTDYVKPKGLRLVLQIAIILTLIALLVWGIQILWG